MAEVAGSTLATSSMARQAAVKFKSTPPISAGTSMPMRPCSNIASRISLDMTPFWSMACHRHRKHSLKKYFEKYMLQWSKGEVAPGHVAPGFPLQSALLSHAASPHPLSVGRGLDGSTPRLSSESNVTTAHQLQVPPSDTRTASSHSIEPEGSTT